MQKYPCAEHTMEKAVFLAGCIHANAKVMAPSAILPAELSFYASQVNYSSPPKQK